MITSAHAVTQISLRKPRREPTRERNWISQRTEASRDGDGLASLLSILGPARTPPDLVLGPSSPRMITPALLYDL